MTAEKKKYTEEYRIETADYAIASNKPAAQVARELGINTKTLSRWVLSRKKELNGEIPISTKADTAETVELKKRVRELEMENEFLKKASAFFAKNQK